METAPQPRVELAHALTGLLAMARPSRLTPEQQVKLRTQALHARADSRYRGYGSLRGALGRNATQVLVDWCRETLGVTYSIRGMIALLNRLGLEYQDRAQGGFWAER
jgi:transposase